MMHICTVATLCFPEKTFPRNYYYCVQDENSLCLCFKNMYRTLFVAIFTSTFIFSMYDHIGLPGCVFPYLSKYKYQQSFSHRKYIFQLRLQKQLERLPLFSPSLSGLSKTLGILHQEKKNCKHPQSKMWWQKFPLGGVKLAW